MYFLVHKCSKYLSMRREFCHCANIYFSTQSNSSYSVSTKGFDVGGSCKRGKFVEMSSSIFTPIHAS